MDWIALEVVLADTLSARISAKTPQSRWLAGFLFFGLPIEAGRGGRCRFVAARLRFH